MNNSFKAQAQPCFIMNEHDKANSRVRRRMQIQKDIDFLCQRYPNAFSHKLGGIRPLKNDILDDLVAELGEDFRKAMRVAISKYMHRPHYLKKITTGKWRRDLQGNRVELIAESDKQIAQQKLDNWYVRRENRYIQNTVKFVALTYPLVLIDD